MQRNYGNYRKDILRKDSKKYTASKWGTGRCELISVRKQSLDNIIYLIQRWGTVYWKICWNVNVWNPDN